MTDKASQLGKPVRHWQQFKGDPVIRDNLFSQQRVNSRFDVAIDCAFDVLADLIEFQGIYHTILHFSSSRAIFWHQEDPYSYWVHDVDEITNTGSCIYYPRRKYHKRACVKPEQVREVFKLFKGLRLQDETVYLRQASLNVINGMVGLTFSCDGSHYMQATEFLEGGLDLWFKN